MNPAPPTPDLPFEAALAQLERLVADLEQGEPELANALAKYEQAIHLLARCHHLIDGAEQTIALLTGVNDQGQPLTAPFDATATLDREPIAPGKVSPDSASPARFPGSDGSDPPF